MEGYEHADHNNNMMPNSANVTYYDLGFICSEFDNMDNSQKLGLHADDESLFGAPEKSVIKHTRSNATSNMHLYLFPISNRRS